MFRLPKRISLVALGLLLYSVSSQSQEIEYTSHSYFYTGASFSVSLDPYVTATRRCQSHGGYKGMKKTGQSNFGYPNFNVECNLFHNPREIFVSTRCENGWRKANEYCYRFTTDRNQATDSGPPSCDASAGNPVNLANGRKYQFEPDYQSAANPLLQFNRYYV